MPEDNPILIKGGSSVISDYGPGSILTGTNLTTLTGGKSRYKPKPPVPLEALNFDSCKINEPATMKFVIKNMSGIDADFNL